MGIRMIATKDMTYATRRLKAGDEIDNVSGPNARLLTALGRAKVAEAAAPAKSTKPQLDHDKDGKAGGSTKQTDDVADLREEYTKKLGKRPFNGWDAEELRKRIADA